MAASTGGSGRQTLTEINVTPLVDVMLVLLIIFMVTAPLIQQGVEVKLPEARAKAIEAEEQKLVLSLRSDRSIWLGAGDDAARIDEVERVADAFAERLRGEVAIDAVAADLEATVDVAVRPATQALWLRSGDV